MSNLNLANQSWASAVLGENLNKTVVWTPEKRRATVCNKEQWCVCVCSRVFVSHPYSIGYLVGGLEHFLFFHILGIIIPTD